MKTKGTFYSYEKSQNIPFFSGDEEPTCPEKRMKRIPLAPSAASHADRSEIAVRCVRTVGQEGNLESATSAARPLSAQRRPRLICRSIVESAFRMDEEKSCGSPCEE